METSPTSSVESEQVNDDTVKVDKSSSNTLPTCTGSSEEFSVSAEMTPLTLAEDGPLLQLSNMSIVEENASSSSSCQPLEAKEGACLKDDDGELLLVNDNDKCKVRFLAKVTVIEEEDIKVDPPKKPKQRKKDKMEEFLEDQDEQEPHPSDIWWTEQELETIELNANYMVKESQQYQEEVICTVLYNKAFLSAVNLAESMSEEEVYTRMLNVADHSNTLEKWTEVGNSRRGLENMMSEKAMEKAILSRARVLHLQKKLRFAAMVAHSHEPAPAEPLAESLAKNSQESTRHARILARMMGQADADALAKAEALLAEGIRMPEPPGRYSGDHEEHSQGRTGRASRNGRRVSLVESIKKGVGNVFKRQGSREVSMKRIRKLQLKRMKEEEPPKRQSQEFRRSFVESLDYGEQ